jgi:hypothetical protein
MLAAGIARFGRRFDDLSRLLDYLTSDLLYTAGEQLACIRPLVWIGSPVSDRLLQLVEWSRYRSHFGSASPGLVRGQQ